MSSKHMVRWKVPPVIATSLALLLVLVAPARAQRTHEKQWKLDTKNPGGQADGGAGTDPTVPGEAPTPAAGNGASTSAGDGTAKLSDLCETCTVKGESPIVDTQSSSHGRPLPRELLDSIPDGRGKKGCSQPVPDELAHALNRALEDYFFRKAIALDDFKDATDPQGNPVGLAIKEALVLLREVAVARLEQARDEMRALRSSNVGHQLVEIDKLRELAPEVIAAKKELDGIDPDNYEDTRAGERELEQDYAKARDRFFTALSKHPLLGVELPRKVDRPIRPDFYDLMVNDEDKQERMAHLYEALDEYDRTIQAEIDRIRAKNTVKDLWELAGPDFGATQAEAAKGSEYTRLQVDAARGVHAGNAAVEQYKSARDQFIVSMALAVATAGAGGITLALPKAAIQGINVAGTATAISDVANASFTAVQIYHDGSSYVVALQDESKAKARSGAEGYDAVRDAQDRQLQAANSVAVNLALSPAQIPGLINALKTGKGIVNRCRSAGSTVKEAKAAGAAAEELGNAGSQHVLHDAQARPPVNSLPPSREIGEMECAPTCIADSARNAGVGVSNEEVVGLAKSLKRASGEPLLRPGSGMRLLDAQALVEKLGGAAEMVPFTTPAELQALKAQGKDILVGIETTAGTKHIVRVQAISADGRWVAIGETAQGVTLQQKFTGFLQQTTGKEKATALAITWPAKNAKTAGSSAAVAGTGGAKAVPNAEQNAAEAAERFGNAGKEPNRPSDFKNLTDADQARLENAVLRGSKSWIPERDATLGQVVEDYYKARPNEKIPPLHTTDKESLKKIAETGTLRPPARGSSFSHPGTGTLRDGNVAIRIKPGSEGKVKWIDNPDGTFGRTPATDLSTEDLQYFKPGKNPSEARWVDFPKRKTPASGSAPIHPQEFTPDSE